MQRDFVAPGGIAHESGENVAAAQAIVPKVQRVLAAAREHGLLVVHTREGHEPDLCDLNPAKQERSTAAGAAIGAKGPLGRFLVRGEYGHDFVDELRPQEGELVLDTSGFGAFHGTDLRERLRIRGVTHLLFISYPIAAEDVPVPREGRNARYDLEHTWSNLVSARWRWLNLYNLNFGYHNAHHDRPAEPWFRLPQVHTELYPADSAKILPYREVWRSFHRNRVRCVLADDPGGVGEGPGRADGFQGVHGVSFLSIV